MNEATQVPIDVSKFKLTPFRHQLQGIEFLLERKYGALFDEPGAGKSYQIVNTACMLYERDEINAVIVACPAGVKSVWSSLQFGEVQKHCYLPATMDRFDGTRRTLSPPRSRLYWVVVSYEFLRDKSNVKELIYQIHQHKLRVMLVCDESIRLKTWNSNQTEGALMLRKHCSRAYILNGTPTGGSPLDLYSQMEILDPKILGCKNFFQFKHRHAIMGGYMNKQVLQFVELERLQNQIKPHALRRLKKDCLDLPEKLYQVVEVPLLPKTWNMYVAMRDQMIIWLSDTDVSIARQAITKIIRLAQITSGFIGGREILLTDDPNRPRTNVEEIGNEKLSWLDTWSQDRIAEEPNNAFIVWSRFTAELDRSYEHFKDRYKCVKIQGGQTKSVRENAIQTFIGNDEDSQSRGPEFLFGQAQAGGLGLTLVKSHTIVFMSNDYNYVTRTQAEDRTHRPGQNVHPLYVDVLATGPKGQRTIDHTIYKALQKKDDMAMWTSNAWRQILEEEREQPF